MKAKYICKWICITSIISHALERGTCDVMGAGSVGACGFVPVRVDLCVWSCACVFGLRVCVLVCTVRMNLCVCVWIFTCVWISACACA